MEVAGWGRGAADHGAHLAADHEVLGDVIADLGAVVRGALAPAGRSGVRGLHGVADILTVALGDLRAAAFSGA